jgi:hypothetical protein
MNARNEKLHASLVSKPEGKRPLRRPRHSSQDNIRMDLRETECEIVDSIHLAQGGDKWQGCPEM